MEVKDDIPTNNVAKSVSMKNRRVASKWQQLAKVIDTQRDEKSTEINEHRNKLLSQRDEIQTRTVSLTSKRPSSEMTSFQSVCDALMARMRQTKQANGAPLERSSTTALQRSTRSWEKKKVNRKNMSFSINELKQKNEPKFKGKQEDETQSTSVAVPEAKPRRPKSAFDLTEEEKQINRKLYSSPMTLPKIYSQTQYRPKQRSFSKDAEYRKRISVDEDSWKDIHHCRYLRIHPLRRSSTMPDLKK